MCPQTAAPRAVARRQRAGGRAATVAYADVFGEGGAGGTGAFYLATAFDTVLMQPGGTLSVTGLAMQGVHARGFLDRWRVRPLLFAREVRGRSRGAGSLQQLACSSLQWSRAGPQAHAWRRRCQPALHGCVCCCMAGSAARRPLAPER